MLLPFTWVLFSALVAYIASQKGRSAILFFALSVIFTPLMMFIAIALLGIKKPIFQYPESVDFPVDKPHPNEIVMPGGDVTWKNLNQEALKHAKNYDWGLYAGTQMEMGDMLYKEGKLQDALNHYLWLVYLDINEPNNCGGNKTNKEFPPFEGKGGILAPVIIRKIAQVQLKLNISEEGLKEIFFIQIAKKRLKIMPLSEIEAWNQIGEAIAVAYSRLNLNK